jgi:hypothetical protein
MPLSPKGGKAGDICRDYVLQKKMINNLMLKCLLQKLNKITKARPPALLERERG